MPGASLLAHTPSCMRMVVCTNMFGIKAWYEGTAKGIVRIGANGFERHKNTYKNSAICSIDNSQQLSHAWHPRFLVGVYARYDLLYSYMRD